MLIDARANEQPIHAATRALFLFACPMRGFHVQDILDTMREDASEDTIPAWDDKAEALVRRLGEGNFRNELSSLLNAIRGMKVFTFSEMRWTQTVTRKVGKLANYHLRGARGLTELQTGQVRRDGDAVMAAVPNSVILGLRVDNEEVIHADKDHSNIVKFASRGDETYEDIMYRIQALVASIAQ